MLKFEQTRVYLEGVHGDEHERARNNGAIFDPKRTQWYVVGEVPEALVDLVDFKTPPAATITDTVNSVREAIGQHKASVPPKDLSPVVVDLVSLAEAARPSSDAPKLPGFGLSDEPNLILPAIYDMSGKESRSIMDVAVFRLSKKELRASEVIRYELSDGFVEVSSGHYGMASIWDYDIVLMAVSYLTEAMNRYNEGKGEKPGRLFRPKVSEILKFCQKGDGGRQAESLIAALDRLKSTTLKMSRNGTRRADGRKASIVAAEGLINNYEVISFNDDAKVESVEIELPNWIYREIVEAKRPDVLTVSRDYFAIQDGLSRFIYRLCRKSAGKNTAKWSFKMLYERSGSTGIERKFSYSLRKIIKENDLPEYSLAEEAGEKGPLLVMTYRGTPAKD